eukprot:gnl/TRDRNA2_/TRDRNA2_72129_c0_seq1.p1 gnl/TRDRNA2_/TRDRNA2_72129_c0~~gnl/TRDRNA2_/TRDRNA2_72129_c0_seq1.p1  ORF type:complete len:273 (+),score=40.08 gnl/TRDRNA2_/TRDRNA2_72129_c0_seq1:3-821(+)
MKWQALPSMHVPRSGAVAAVLARRLYICGGHDGNSAQSHVECFDPAVGTWQKAPAMMRRRFRSAAASLGGRIYVCGGSDGGDDLASVECYNPRSGMFREGWQAVRPMQHKRFCPSAAVIGNHLYVCGGSNGAFGSLQSVEHYDLATSTWERLPPMAQRRSGAAVAVMGGRLYVCGGNDGRGALNSVERFNPSAGAWEAVAAGAWESIPPMSRARFCASAASIGGQLYVCGGSDKEDLLRSAERFDPTTGTWEALPRMRLNRTGAAAAVLLSF